MPCGNTNIPSPKLFTSLPDASNLRTVGKFDPAQVFAPHLSATQMDLPSRSISTALVAPHVRPVGIFAQFSTVANGLGGALTGWILPWVHALPANIAIVAMIAGVSMNLTRPECDIAVPPLYVLLNLTNRGLPLLALLRPATERPGDQPDQARQDQRQHQP